MHTRVAVIRQPTQNRAKNASTVSNENTHGRSNASSPAHSRAPHDHYTPCDPTERAPTAPPADADTLPPNKQSCRGSPRPTPRPSRSGASSPSAPRTRAVHSLPHSKTPSRAAWQSHGGTPTGASACDFQEKSTGSEAGGACASDASVRCRACPCRRCL